MGSGASVKSIQPYGKDKICIVSAPAYPLSVQYSCGNIPQCEVIKIRHRSPEEVESIAIPAPSEGRNFIIKIKDSCPMYFSKWITYFLFEAEGLPDDQAFVLSYAFRAPPVVR